MNERTILTTIGDAHYQAMGVVLEKVIVAECLLPEAPKANAETQVLYYGDLAMLTYNIGGKERTKKEFESLAKEAGFAHFKAECCALNMWVMEFLK